MIDVCVSTEIYNGVARAKLDVFIPILNYFKNK